jgi:hypothetical protein
LLQDLTDLQKKENNIYDIEQKTWTYHPKGCS